MSFFCEYLIEKKKVQYTTTSKNMNKKFIYVSKQNHIVRTVRRKENNLKISSISFQGHVNVSANGFISLQNHQQFKTQSNFS